MTGTLHDRPLSDVTVVEVATYVAGPFAAQMLAHLGADVVKVEPPRGDPTRRFGLTHDGLSAVFVNVNHGKRSRFLDLKASSGKESMLELLAGADVFIHNWRPGVARRLGLDFETLAPAIPGLIWVSITGFGEHDPRAAAPAFDQSVQALTGLSAWEAEGRRPEPLRSAFADKVTAAFVAQAVLAALFRRERTGAGCRVDLAMVDALAYFNFPDVLQDHTFLPPAPPERLPRAHSNILPTSDGHIVVTPVSGRQIAAALAAAGHPEWIAEVRAATSPGELVERLFTKLSSVTPSRTTAVWESLFADHDVPAVALCSVEDHLGAFDHLYSTTDSDVGPVRRVRYPALYDEAPLPPVGPPPSFSEGGES